MTTKNKKEDDNADYFSDSELGSDGEPMKISILCKYTKSETFFDTAKTFLEKHLTKKITSQWDIVWFDSNA